MSARTFRVWAPHAELVEVETEQGRRPMAPTGTGWFTCDIDGLGECVDYTFRVDGSDPMPDPRSRFQPAGVHGPSRLVESETARSTPRSRASIICSASG